MIQELLADMATEIHSGRPPAHWAATLADSGKRARLEASLMPSSLALRWG